jgi:hypothetical protein
VHGQRTSRLPTPARSHLQVIRLRQPRVHRTAGANELGLRGTQRMLKRDRPELRPFDHRSRSVRTSSRCSPQDASTEPKDRPPPDGAHAIGAPLPTAFGDLRFAPAAYLADRESSARHAP